MAEAPRDPGAPSNSSPGSKGRSSAKRSGAPDSDGAGSGSAVVEEDLDGKAIANGLRARDPEVQRVFLKQYRALILHCIGQFESDSEAREDLYQEIVAYVFERLDKDSYDPRKGTFGTWLYRVAWCRSVDLKRREGTGRRLPTVASSEEIVEPSDARPGPSQSADTIEIGALVQASLEQLDPEEAELLRMRHMREMTLVDIAAVRSQSLETVKYRLKRATQSLRQRLATHRITEEVVS